MKEKEPSSLPSRSPHGFSRSTVAALGFLILSLIVSGLIVAGAFRRPPEARLPETGTALVSPQAANTAAPTQTPELTAGAPEDTPQPAAPPASPTVPAGTPVVSVVALEENADPAVSEALAAAIRLSLETASLPDPATVRLSTLPPGITSPAAIHLARDATGSALLVAWQDAGEGITRVYLFAAAKPAPARVEDTPVLWTLRTPENFPVYVGYGGDFTLPAELAVGALEMEAGNVDRANERFRVLQGLPSDVPADLQDSNRAVILFAVGQGMVERGDLAGALQTYSKALRLADDFQAARTNRGNLYLALGDAATATAAFDKVQASLPGYLPPLYNRAIAHQVGGDLPAALADADQLITLRPDAAWSFNLRGFLHYSQADYEDALADFTQAATADPDAVIPLFNQAATLYVLGDYDKALSVYEVILESEPDNPVFYLYRGLALQAVGDFAQARLAYTWAVILDADYVDAYLRRARLRLELAEYDPALADCEKALALDPDDGRAYAIIGDVHLAQENFVEAERAYTAAIERGQAGPEVYAGRGWAWQRRRYAPTAVKDYEQALQLGANDPLLLYRLGFAYFEVGLYKEALDALLGAVNGGLDTAEAHAALSLALDANLQRAEAEQEFRQAIELDSRYGDIDFLVEQPLWSETAVARAQTILRRLESE